MIRLCNTQARGKGHLKRRLTSEDGPPTVYTKKRRKVACFSFNKVDACLWHTLLAKPIQLHSFQPLSTKGPCLQQFHDDSADTIRKHLAKHVAAMRPRPGSTGWLCLWGGCRTSWETLFLLRQNLYKAHGLTAKSFFRTYCPVCVDEDLSFDDEFSWTSHCEMHLTRGDGCPSFCCPVCFDDNSLNPVERFRVFQDGKNQQAHVAKLHKESSQVS